jgi:FKBP-type peptidyl-prolyl cis-trans isomerase
VLIKIDLGIRKCFSEVENKLHGGSMFRGSVLVLLLAVGAAALFAQSGAKPDTTKPTKVMGPGKSTESGTKYWDIKVGTGAVATKGLTATVHYTGWLANGTKFDSSVDRGEPLEFIIGGRVIKGWNEGVVGMKVGGKRQLRIPPESGYGPSGNGPIPPNSTLIFDVELLGLR